MTRRRLRLILGWGRVAAELATTRSSREFAAQVEPHTYSTVGLSLR